ncbi:hypothetical protein COI88_13630 [Bacillus cereus]|nr:hypothetical protein COI88_13630 [Bacillus cereus]
MIGPTGVTRLTGNTGPIGSTGPPAPGTTCFQDIRTALQHCAGRFVTLRLSGCCDSIQGQISSVDEGTIVFISAEGTSIISICNIVLITSVLLAYVINNGDNSISIINISTNTIIAPPILVGTDPAGIAITPDGTRAYVTNFADNSVSVINVITNTVVGGTIPVDNDPIAIAITPSCI